MIALFHLTSVTVVGLNQELRGQDILKHGSGYVVVMCTSEYDF